MYARRLSRPHPIDGFVLNMVPVTIANMIGGGVLVGADYWFVYLRLRREVALNGPACGAI